MFWQTEDFYHTPITIDFYQISTIINTRLSGNAFTKDIQNGKFYRKNIP